MPPECARTVATTEKLGSNHAGGIYDIACLWSLFSGVAIERKDSHATRSVALLCQAIVKGLTGIPHLLPDPDLAPLRGRVDYADLLWDLVDTPTQTKP